MCAQRRGPSALGALFVSNIFHKIAWLALKNPAELVNRIAADQFTLLELLEYPGVDPLFSEVDLLYPAFF